MRDRVESMLRIDSEEVKLLLPHVWKVQQAVADLKIAITNEEPAGERLRSTLQQHYLEVVTELCHKTVRLCNNEWWPQLFLYAYRATHPGRVTASVDPEAIRRGFRGLIDPDLLEDIVLQAESGLDIHLHQQPTASRAPVTSSARQFKDGIWRSMWVDVANGSTFVFGPECGPYMKLARVQGYALHRIPKKSTVTGLPTGKGRLIADLSYENAQGVSINSLTWIEWYGNFRMAQHSDVAQMVLALRCWFPKAEVELAKYDVANAFRRIYLSVSSFGILGSEHDGHPLLDQAEVFGHNIAPSGFSKPSELKRFDKPVMPVVYV